MKQMPNTQQYFSRIKAFPSKESLKTQKDCNCSPMSSASGVKFAFQLSPESQHLILTLIFRVTSGTLESQTFLSKIKLWAFLTHRGVRRRLRAGVVRVQIQVMSCGVYFLLALSKCLTIFITQTAPYSLNIIQSSILPSLLSDQHKDNQLFNKDEIFVMCVLQN